MKSSWGVVGVVVFLNKKTLNRCFPTVWQLFVDRQEKAAAAMSLSGKHDSSIPKKKMQLFSILHPTQCNCDPLWFGIFFQEERQVDELTAPLTVEGPIQGVKSLEWWNENWYHFVLFCFVFKPQLSVPSAITGRWWGFPSRPGGSTPAGCWSPSGGYWWRVFFCSCPSRDRAVLNLIQSSRPGPAGAAGSSPWGRKKRNNFSKSINK